MKRRQRETAEFPGNYWLKTGFAKEIEGLKLRLSERTKAFNELLRASSGYYDALAELEKGVFNQARVETADSEMQKVRYLKAHLHENCREAWMRFWQEAANTASEARRAPPERLADLWRSKAKVLAEWLDHFIEQCQEKHQLGAIDWE